jgi:hypothetical protein
LGVFEVAFHGGMGKGCRVGFAGVPG